MVNDPGCHLAPDDNVHSAVHAMAPGMQECIDSGIRKKRLDYPERGDMVQLPCPSIPESEYPRRKLIGIDTGFTEI